MARQQAAIGRWGIEMCVACVFSSVTLQSHQSYSSSESFLALHTQAQQEDVLKHVWRLFMLYVSKMKVHIQTLLNGNLLMQVPMCLLKHVRWQGGVDTPVPVPPVLDMFWSWCGLLRLSYRRSPCKSSYS